MKLRRVKGRDRDLARRVDEARQQNALSYSELADKAGYNERTIRNFISGQPTRAKTRRDICQAVGVDFLEGKRLISAADEAHGQYTRDQVKDYAGLFLHIGAALTCRTS